MATTKTNYVYKYKPSTASYFVSDSASSTQKALDTKVKNLEKRFEASGVSLTGDKNVDNRNLLEKALNVTPDQNIIMDVLEVMDRPRETVANVLSSIGDKDKRNLLEAAWDGLSGKEKISSKDALQNLTGLDLTLDDKEGFDLADVGNFVIDTGLDILTDPTTYLGWGFVTKPLKAGAGAAGSAIGEGLEVVAKGGSKFAETAQTLQGMGKEISYAFNATKGWKDNFIKELSKIKGSAQTEVRKLAARAIYLRKLAETLGVEDAGKLINNMIESGVTIVKKGDTWVPAVTSNAVARGKDIVENLATQFASGSNKALITHELPQIAATNKRALKQLDAFIEKLNKAIPSADGTPLFTVINKNNSYAIKFTGDQNALKEQISLWSKADPEGILKSNITIGKRKLSQAEKDLIAKHGDKVNEILTGMREIRDGANKLLRSNGKYAGFDMVGQTNEEYMRHVPTEKAMESVRENAPIGKRYKYPGADDLAKRDYQGTAKEMNQAMKDLYGVKNDLFNEDAFESIEDLINIAHDRNIAQETASLVLKPAKEAVQGGMFKISKNTRGSVEEAFGRDYIPLPKGFEEEFKDVFKNLPPEMKKDWQKMLQEAGLETKAGEILGMQRSTYNMFMRLNKSQKPAGEFMKLYDKLMTSWKGINLLSPGFHARNFAGNSSNMFLAGMGLRDQARYTTKAFLDLKFYDDYIKKVAQGLQVSPEDLARAQEIEGFFQSGVAQGHQGVRDLQDVKAALEKSKAGTKTGIKKIYDKTVDLNFKWSEKMDDLQRYAMYKWSLEKAGGNAGMAMRNVREALFDYGDLTEFEKNTMKRLVPFYTFMKNNIRFQAKNIIKNPGQYANMLRGYKYWGQDIAQTPIEDMPDYMVGNMWLPIPLNIDSNDEEAITFLKLNLPAADFAEFVSNPLKRGVTSVTVPIKAAWEWGTNVDTFTGNKIVDFPGQKNQMADGAILSQLRGKDGSLYLSKDPMIQQIADELGLRNPRKLASSILDVLDTATGDKKSGDLITSILEKSGVSSTKNLSEIELTNLYQRLEYLRNMQKLYEQETGGKLPTLADLGLD